MANSMRTAASNREKADAEKAAANNAAADAQRPEVRKEPAEEPVSKTQIRYRYRQIRRSPTQKSTEIQNRAMLEALINKAFIEGCLLYKDHGNKKTDKLRLSASDIAAMMEEKYRVKLSPRTIQDYVKQGRAGEPLKKRGPPPAFLPRETFDFLVEA